MVALLTLAIFSLLCALFLTIPSVSARVLALSLQPSLQPIQQQSTQPPPSSSTSPQQQQQQGTIARGIIDSLSGISGQQQQQEQPQPPPAPSTLPPASSSSPTSIPQQPQQQAAPTTTTTTATEGIIARGIIDSLIFTPTATWIATGNWTIGVNNGAAALVTANMTWYNDNGTASHTHGILNFRPITVGQGQEQQPITVQPEDKSVSLSGAVDVGANNRIAWDGVQSTIDIKKGGKILSISLDDAQTNNHFGGRSIYGIVTSFTRCSDVPGPNMEMPTPCLNISIPPPPTPATSPAVSAAPSPPPTTAAPVSPPSPSPSPPAASNATGKSPFDILGGG